MQATANLGGALGSFVAAMMKDRMSREDLESWGWRCPFWFGMLAGVGGHLVKDLVKESHELPAALDEGLSSLCLPHSRLYGEYL